jgi:hypothetical protein
VKRNQQVLSTQPDTYKWGGKPSCAVCSFMSGCNYRSLLLFQ